MLCKLRQVFAIRAGQLVGLEVYIFECPLCQVGPRRTFKRVKKEDGSACGRALRLRRTVVIGDVEKDAEFATFLTDAKVAGFRAVQSTPFFTSDDLFLGMVSTHFANPHAPTPIELKTMRMYSLVAAEHAYQLLGNASLAAKAQRMNEELYASILAKT